MVPTRCNHVRGALEKEESGRLEIYTCAGCAQFGYGSCFKCTLCGSRLHAKCALHEVAITHRFFPDSHLRFLPSGGPNRRCDACGRDIDGYVYHCSKTKYDLHPTCAFLKDKISVPETGITLFLRKTTSSKCCECGKKELDGGCRRFRSWVYESTNKEYCLHVSCANNILMKFKVDGAAAPPVHGDLTRHPIFPGCVFKFQRSAGRNRYCDACDRDVEGPCYHCSEMDYDLHPTCATLKLAIHPRGMATPLVLGERMSSRCAKCRKKPKKGSNCWGYISRGEEYYHIYCAMELLEATGEEKGGTSRGGEVMDQSYAAPARDLVVHRKPRKKGVSFMKMVKIALTVLISALVGDPTTLIATFIATMLTSN